MCEFMLFVDCFNAVSYFKKPKGKTVDEIIKDILNNSNINWMTEVSRIYICKSVVYDDVEYYEEACDICNRVVIPPDRKPQPYVKLKMFKNIVDECYKRHCFATVF